MAAFSRGLRFTFLKNGYNCSQCLGFSSTATVQSGHSRWSKIKHDKGSADVKKTRERTQLAQKITLASKLNGPDPNSNLQLDGLVATAKKTGVPKEIIEKAIARGQGRSSSGAALENVALELIIENVAMIVDAETDKQARTLQDLRVIIKKHGGQLAPTNYLFQRKGRVSFEQDDRNLGVDQVLDEAIEAGADDVQTDEDGSIVVWTEPNMITAAANSLQKSLALKTQSSDIIWDANEDTKVPIDSEETATKLSTFLDAMHDYPDVLDVYANAAQGSVGEQAWEGLQSRLG